MIDLKKEAKSRSINWYRVNYRNMWNCNDDIQQSNIIVHNNIILLDAYMMAARHLYEETKKIKFAFAMLSSVEQKKFNKIC